jgi:hypothetical protein
MLVHCVVLIYLRRVKPVSLFGVLYMRCKFSCKKSNLNLLSLLNQKKNEQYYECLILCFRGVPVVTVM